MLHRSKENLLMVLDGMDPELKRTFDKLGIPLEEQKYLSGVAVDAVLDSVSVKTTFRETLAELGIVFCSFSEAVKEYPRSCQEIYGYSCPLHRQLLCNT